MPAFFSNNSAETKPALVAIMVLLAAAFRCYHLTEIPLTNDELSALYRLRFFSFSELISQGVMPDGHPALVQVFLYYYTRLAGTSPVALKLPFILCGTAAVYLAYRVFASWFNARTGLLVAAYMAASQFFIMHSQTARPYAPGLLLLLAVVMQLQRIASGKARTKHYVYVCVLLVLLASTHYLALLTGVCCALVFWYQARPQRKKLLITYAVAMALYLPQVPIFLHQFSTGGVGSWLGKPGTAYLLEFGNYLAQYQTALAAGLLTGLAAAVALVVFYHNLPRENRTAWLMSAVIFTLTYLVLHGYSVWRNPVLQYPALLFVTPFLLAVIFYPASLLPRTACLVLLVGVMALQSYALVFTRKHYEVFYQQGYPAAVESIAMHSRSGTPLLLNGNQPFYFTYYFARQPDYVPNVIHTRIDSLTYSQFDSLLRQVKADTIVLAHGFYLSPEYLSMARNRFPDSIFFSQSAFTDTYVLGRQPLVSQQDTPGVWFDAGREFGEPVTAKVRAWCGLLHMDASVNVSRAAGSGADPLLVLTVKDQTGKQVYWGAHAWHDYHPDTALTGMVFTPAVIPVQKGEEYEISVAVWNEKRQEFRAGMPALHVMKGNGRLFGTVEPLRD